MMDGTLAVYWVVRWVDEMDEMWVVLMDVM